MTHVELKINMILTLKINQYKNKLIKKENKNVTLHYF